MVFSVRICQGAAPSLPESDGVVGRLKATTSSLLLDALGRGPRREYRLMIRLARTLATAQLEEDLRVLADSSSPAAARSIERVADAVEEARTHPAERLSDRMRS